MPAVDGAARGYISSRNVSVLSSSLVEIREHFVLGHGRAAAARASIGVVGAEVVDLEQQHRRVVRHGVMRMETSRSLSSVLRQFADVARPS